MRFTEAEIEQLRRTAYFCGRFMPVCLAHLLPDYGQPGGPIRMLAETLLTEFPVLKRLDPTGELGQHAVTTLVCRTLGETTCMAEKYPDEPAAAQVDAAVQNALAAAAAALEEIKPPITNRIRIYTDGACSGNPGPGAVGVIWIVDNEPTEYAEPVPGLVTNSYVELHAIRRALEQLTPEEKARPITVYTDSQYAVNVLVLGCRAKVHQELILYIQELLRPLDAEVVHIRGHAQHWANEQADRLAHAAVPRGT